MPVGTRERVTVGGDRLAVTGAAQVAQKPGIDVSHLGCQTVNLKHSPTANCGRLASVGWAGLSCDLNRFEKSVRLRNRLAALAEIINMQLDSLYYKL